MQYIYDDLRSGECEMFAGEETSEDLCLLERRQVRSLSPRRPSCYAYPLAAPLCSVYDTSTLMQGSL